MQPLFVHDRYASKTADGNISRRSDALGMEVKAKGI